MEYFEKIALKDGRECILRNGTEKDGLDVHNNFNLTHGQTDYLLSYPDENTFTAEKEAEFLKEKTKSSNEIEIVAIVDGVVAGTGGIEAIGKKDKIKHRAEFGVGVDKAYWNLGIGSALLKASIECAKKAGYEQIELNVVAENETAIAMYEKAGFTEFGRNKRGFKSRISGYQELVYMRLEL